MIRGRPKRAQAMLEFSLVLPLILLLMILSVELGRVVYYYSALNNAVREGARFGIVQLFPSSADRLAEIQQRVMGYAIWLPLSGGNIQVYCDMDPSNTTNPCDNYVTVSASVDIAPMVPLVPRLLGSGTSWHLQAESTMLMTPYGKQ